MILKKDLDHQVWKNIKAESLQDQKIIVALSGGIDSVALLVTLKKVHKKLAAAYFHHGESEIKEQNDYREKAAQFCQRLCKKLNIEFHLVKSSQFLKSEADMREQRYQGLIKLLKSENANVLALAHHRDDLLETRMLRLIRGTGGQGLGAMSLFKAPYFRPFLENSKKELKAYLAAEKIRYLKDPSNESTDPLRNWLREEWFKDLEKRQKGSLKSLARSLETLANEVSAVPTWDLLAQNEEYELSQGLSRLFYLSLTLMNQKKLLAQYLLSLGKRDFTQSHLEEICKRLDNLQKVITFRVARMDWKVNAEQIKVES